MVHVIFLDIDGVLNNQNSMHEGSWIQALDHTNWDRESIRVLNEIIECTGANIVISSTWRKLKPSVVWWNEQFALAGISGKCIDITHSSPNGFRGREVAEWLEVAEVFCGPITYVILDDDSDFYPYQNRVWIDGREGLRDKHWASAVALLQGGPMTRIDCMEERNPPNGY